uniref:Kallikrein related peptidase 5 n=1 Tax=Monodelphis domestica TaxID=13616 RepID=A0A5F8HI01_MONDO
MNQKPQSYFLLPVNLPYQTTSQILYSKLHFLTSDPTPSLDPTSSYQESSSHPPGQNQACQEYGTRQAAGTHPETGTRQEAGSLSQGETRQENDRILNGKDCQPQTQPWQAALFLRPNRLYCGAVLVHPQWVLTAAHCQKPAYSVRLGRYHLQGIDPGQRILRGVKSFPHPKYTRPAHSNDLMLIKLNGRVSMTPSIKTIKISTQPPRPGTQCLVSGWGTTSSPQGKSCASSSHCYSLSLSIHLAPSFPQPLGLVFVHLQVCFSLTLFPSYLERGWKLEFQELSSNSSLVAMCS